MADKADENIKCFTCEPIDLYLAQAESFTRNLGDAMNAPLESLLLSLVALWVTVTGIKLLMGATSPLEIVKDAFFIALAASLFHAQGGATIIVDIYNAALSIMGDASAVAFKVAGGSVSSGRSGLSALAESGEAAIKKVTDVVAAITTSASTFNIGPWVAAFLLLIPYIVLILVYFGQVAVAIFRMMVLACFGPFLLICFAFGWGRQMASAGFKATIATILVLFASTVALAMAISGITHLDLKGASDDPVAFAAFNNSAFWAAVAIGWMTIAFMSEAASLANAIAGTFLSNQAAMIISGAMQATGLAALKKGRDFAANAYGAAKNDQQTRSQRADNIASRRDELVSRARNINNTPS
ncbi:type IV secretion system protein [Insolitispirillum peregrinum]|uniref:type IV secretion system protein n=1 Tax=Insolitispirillum peregrinum TaxID=80876 RepID=UPI003612FCD1